MSLEKTKKQLIELLGGTDSKVIALSGRWGTGKTHLWNEIKTDSADEKVKKALYVSLFGLSNIDQIKRKLMEGALPDAVVGGRKLGAFKNLFKSSLHAAATHYKALAAINDLNLLLLAPLALRERVIVIDDIERKHAKLGIDEVLGFIDEYSEEFRARFVLVLNDDQLAIEGEQRALWDTFREKVIDQEVKLSTTPDEAFSIAIKLWPSPKYEAALKQAVLTCGLTNIRIIGKVIRVANQILANRNLEDAIQARVIPSIVLFAAIYYHGLEDGPDLQFALGIGNSDWSMFSQDKKSEPTEEENRESRWRAFMTELGIMSCDGFEKALVEFLESGLFESEKIQAIIERYANEAQTSRVHQKAYSFIMKAFWDHRATDKELIAEAHDFPTVIGELNPYDTTQLHDALTELEDGQNLADEVIRAWIAAYKDRGCPATDGNPFGNRLHPNIQAALNDAVAQQQAQATVVETCSYIAEHSGWGTLQEIVMKRATANDFESAIRGMDIEGLQKFMHRMIDMRVHRGTYDPHFGHATDNFVEACRTIANDQRPESARLAKLMKRLFTQAMLSAELEPTRSAQPVGDTPQPGR